MSEEESQPAPLRLKPRARLESESAAPKKSAPTAPLSSAPTPSPVEPSDERPTLRPRLRPKPRLNREDEVQAEASKETENPIDGPPLMLPPLPVNSEAALPPLPPLPPPPAPSSPPPSPSPVAPPAPVPSSAPPPSFKIKPKPAEPKPAPSFKLRLQTPNAAGTSSQPPSSSSADTPPALPPRVGSGDSQSVPPLFATDPPLPIADPQLPEDDELLQPPDHLVPHLHTTQPVAEGGKKGRATPAKPEPQRRKSNPLKGLLIFLGVLLVLGGVFWFAGRGVYQRFFAAEQPQERATSIPAQLIDKAQTVVAAQNPLDLASMTEEGNIPADVSTTNSGASTTPGDSTGSVAADSPEVIEADIPPLPPVKLEPPAPPPPPPPSAQFVSTIERAILGGVFQGDPPKALINGRTIRAGETVDERLGIIFVGLDETRLKLIFRDSTGAEYIRKF